MSDADRESPRDLAAAYALGALDAEEARAFEALLASSPEARADLAEYREVAALLALGGSGTGPSEPLRECVLGSMPKTGPSISPIDSSRRRSTPGGLLPWLGVAAALALAFIFWRNREALQRELAARDSVVVAREAQLAQREATLNAILEPGVTMYSLTATGEAAPGMQLFLDRNRSVAVVHAYRLRPAAAGRTYQLWFIRDGTPVPSVTFNSGSDGQALVQRITVPDGALSAAAVTEEPAGGSRQPSTTPFLVGSIGRT